MTNKTLVHFQADRQEISIQRVFNIPVELLYKAYSEAQFVAQWMGTNVVKLEHKTHGAYHFETRDPEGNIVLNSHGVIHEVIENSRIVRTFEMTNTPFPAQLEFLNFKAITSESSQLNMKVIYQSIEIREQILSLPFATGINMAHNKLENLFIR